MRFSARSWIAIAALALLILGGYSDPAKAQYAAQCQNGSCAALAAMPSPTIPGFTVSMPNAPAVSPYAMATQQAAGVAVTSSRFRFNVFQRSRFVGGPFRLGGRRSCASGGCS